MIKTLRHCKSDECTSYAAVTVFDGNGRRVGSFCKSCTLVIVEYLIERDEDIRIKGIEQ